MPQPDAVVDLVFDELERSTTVGETRSRAELQAACGLGAGDLTEVLDRLRGEGRITEEAPDEFMTREEDDGEPVQPPALAAVLASRPRDAGPPTERSAAATLGLNGKRVELTAAVATAIGPEGLGNLVTAGIKEASEAGVPFVFEVVP